MASQDGKIRKDDLVEKGTESVYKDLENQAVSSIKAITKELDNLSKQQSKLGLSTKDIASLQKQQRIELNKLSIEAKKAATANLKVNQARKESLAAIKQETAAIRRDTAAKKANEQAAKKQVKSNNKLTTSFKNLLTSITAFIGVRMFMDFFKDVFALTKQLNSMAFAMKAVIKDQFELGQTVTWLSKITNNFGAELVTTTERYIKFRAASIQAGLSAKETQSIFGTMTKAAGVLGLKTDELRGIYLALEQMISKGKITTEELRRQLGERLPGAMDIMAKSMNVTTAELDDMMKKGLVISKDVLPKFAEQIEIAFGIQNVNKVDTLTASSIRLKNAWTELVKSIEGSQGLISGTFQTIIDKGTEIITTYREITSLFKAFTSEISSNRLGNAWKAVQDKEIGVFKWARLVLKATTNALTMEKQRNATIAEAVRLTKENSIVSLSFNEVLKIGTALSKLSVEQLTEYIAKLKESINAGDGVAKLKEGTVAWYRKEITAQKELIEAEKERGDIIPIQAEVNRLQKELNILLGIQDKKGKELIKFMEGSIGWLEQQISKNNTIIKQATDNSTRTKYREENVLLQEQLDKLTKIKVKVENIQTTLAQEDIEIKVPIGVEVDEEKFRASFEEIMDLAAQFNDAVGGLFDAISDRRLEAIDAEIDAEEKKYDRLIELAKDDAAQKEVLERNRDELLASLEKKRLKEEQKAAKQRKAFALVDVAINTAVQISKVLANPFLVAAVATLGAIQAATVLAQPIPQFAEGGTMGWDGKALINDGGNREFVERNGQIFSSPIKNAVVDLQKGDIIHKDMDALMNASIMTSLANDNKNLDSSKLKLIFDNNYAGLEKTIKNGFNNANVNTNVKLNGFDHAHQAYKESQSRWS